MDMLLHYSEAQPKVNTKWQQNPLSSRGAKKDFVMQNIRVYPKRRRKEHLLSNVSQSAAWQTKTIDEAFSPFHGEAALLSASQTPFSPLSGPSPRPLLERSKIGLGQVQTSRGGSPPFVQRPTAINQQWQADASDLIDRMLKHIVKSLQVSLEEIRSNILAVKEVQSKQSAMKTDSVIEEERRNTLSADDLQKNSLENLLTSSVEPPEGQGCFDNSIIFATGESANFRSKLPEVIQMKPRNRRKFLHQALLLNETREMLIVNILKNLENGERGEAILANVEKLPLCFKDDIQFKDIVQDVYPILKVLIQFHLEKNQHNYSFKNVLKSKIMMASQSLGEQASQKDHLSTYQDSIIPDQAVKPMVTAVPSYQPPRRAR